MRQLDASERARLLCAACGVGCAASASQVRGFFDLLEPLAARIPLVTALGNHDGRSAHQAQRAWRTDATAATAASGGHSAVDVADYLEGLLPAAPHRPPWHSFDHRGVHFVVLDVDSDYSVSSTQHEWLSADLAGDGAGRSSWTVVMMHRPMYSSDAWHENRRDRPAEPRTAGHLTAALEPLFADGRVDLVVAGHLHGWERTHPVAANGSVVILPVHRQHNTATARPSSAAAAGDVYREPGAPVYLTVG